MHSNYDSIISSYRILSSRKVFVLFEYNAYIFRKFFIDDCQGISKNFVILLGGGERSRKDYIRLQGGEGYTKRLHWITRGRLSWFKFSLDKGSKKTQIFTCGHPFFGAKRQIMRERIPQSRLRIDRVRIQGNSNPAANPVNIPTSQNPKSGFKFN